MAKYTDMFVAVGTRTIAAVQLTFHEDLPEEVEEWIPLSLIENVEALDNLDKDGNTTLSIAKWILKDKDIPYESETDTTDHRFGRSSVDEDEYRSLHDGKD